MKLIKRRWSETSAWRSECKGCFSIVELEENDDKSGGNCVVCKKPVLAWYGFQNGHPVRLVAGKICEIPEAEFSHMLLGKLFPNEPHSGTILTSEDA